MKFLVFCLYFLFCSANILSQTPRDTITITDSTNSVTWFYPGRSVLVPKLATNPFVDSIRVGIHIINEGNRQYYLIVRDKKGNTRLEGNFFDEFPDGHVIEYDAKGKISAEGNYRIEKLKKPEQVVRTGGKKFGKYYSSRKDGTWKYYNTNGRVLKEVKY
jgi:antitoxin component YwqK of YwqJK toxin-antitoxin module